MHIIEVTPFSKSVRSDTLSYFSSAPIKPGALVSIPLRSRTIRGLVISVKDAKESRIELRGSKFTLKRIKNVSKENLFAPEFVTAAINTAEYFATSTGSIIQALIPNNLFEDIQKLRKKSTTKNETKEIKQNRKLENIEHPKFVLQCEDRDRYSEYKSTIRTQFAHGKSVLFCVPTIEDGIAAERALSRGIEKHTFFLHNRLKKSEVISTWNSVLVRDNPSLIIVTGSFVGMPVSNLGTIIIDRESSNAWRIQVRPNFDLRYFIEQYAGALGAELILGDLMLRAVTLWRFDQHEFVEYSPVKFRSITDARQKIVPINRGDEFISEELLTLLNGAIDRNEHTFLLTNRKGLAPIIVCGDCGEVVRCDNCGAPVRLHGKDARRKENFFRCHACSAERGAGETCKKCGSWRLIPFGVGTERVAFEIRNTFPKSKVFVLDKNIATTPKRAQKIIEDFYSAPSAIIIGTEMALLYLHDTIENCAVISIDAMFALPDYRIQERILNILLRTRALASQNFLVQTRNTDASIFRNIIEGNLTDFYRNEFIDRKRFNYPPFSLIIKISLIGKTTRQIEKQFAGIANTFAPHELKTYPAFMETVRGKKICHGMIKIPRDDWPDKSLVEKLRSLPPQYKVEIDAESVL